MNQPTQDFAPHFRLARKADVAAIVATYAEDILGRDRETTAAKLDPGYLAAWEAIESDPNNEIVVAEIEGTVVGSLQVTYTPSLSYGGGWRATFENVHVVASFRNRGIGRLLVEHAIARARHRGCIRVQLTSNKVRTDAHRFYERLGFVASHEGMKLQIDE